MLDKLVLILLGVWALIFGIIYVTDLKISFGPVIMGFAALACGIVCLFRAFTGPNPPK